MQLCSFGLARIFKKSNTYVSTALLKTLPKIALKVYRINTMKSICRNMGRKKGRKKEGGRESKILTGCLWRVGLGGKPVDLESLKVKGQQ